MMAIHQEDQYRWQIGAAAKNSGGDITDEIIGLAIGRTLVREGIGESYYPFFTSEVIKAIVRQRSRGGNAYGREAFRGEFVGLTKALERENLDITEEGELCRPGASIETYDVSWIDDFDRNVLDAARDILQEVKQRLDMDVEATTVTISGHWRKDGGMIPHPIDQKNDRRNRLNLLKTLQQRKVVRSFREARSSGGRTGIEVEADRDRVKVTVTAITDLFEGRRERPSAAAPKQPPFSMPPPRESLPKNEQDALPNPIVLAPAPTKPLADPAKPKPFEEFGREYGKGVAGELGKRTGTLIAIIVGVILLAALGIAQDWWGKATRWLRAQAQTAQSDATRAR
jgi:hypothetical protein